MTLEEGGRICTDTEEHAQFISGAVGSQTLTQFPHDDTIIPLCIF